MYLEFRGSFVYFVHFEGKFVTLLTDDKFGFILGKIKTLRTKFKQRKVI